MPRYTVVDESTGDRKREPSRLQEASLQGALYEAILCLKTPDTSVTLTNPS